MGNYIFTSSASETDAGTKWREKAKEYNDQRAICFEKSQLAFQKGDHEMAKQWSDSGKAFGLKMDDCNSKAAKAIFESLNGSSLSSSSSSGKQMRPPRTYDFHGLFVKEALQKLEEIVTYAQKQQWSDVTIIVGRGNHSLHGISKLPSAVKDFAQTHSDVVVNYHLDQPTKGCILLELSDSHHRSICIIQ